jgi:hypothetical protein
MLVRWKCNSISWISSVLYTWPCWNSSELWVQLYLWLLKVANCENWSPIHHLQETTCTTRKHINVTSNSMAMNYGWTKRTQEFCTYGILAQSSNIQTLFLLARKLAHQNKGLHHLQATTYITKYVNNITMSLIWYLAMTDGELTNSTQD